MGEIGGEVEETELVVLLGRLIRPPNEPSNILGGGGEGRGEVECNSCKMIVIAQCIVIHVVVYIR